VNATDVAVAIGRVCDNLKAMLLEKNVSYGNSALEPLRIFSKTDPLEQLNVRIDDKLSRIARGHEYAGDDTELDLLGYLVLRRVARLATEAEGRPLVRVGRGDRSNEWRQNGQGDAS
jgi:hypothetical protein